jgi:hypothetical protein
LSDIYQALARTALLIELDIFGPEPTTTPSSTGCATRPPGSSPTGPTSTHPPGRPPWSPSTRFWPCRACGSTRTSRPPQCGPASRRCAARACPPPCSTTPPTCSPADQPGLRQPRTSPSPWATPRPRQARSGSPAPAGPRRPGWPGWDGDGRATDRPGQWPQPRPPRPKDCAPPCPALPSASAALPRATRDGGPTPAGTPPWT